VKFANSIGSYTYAFYPTAILAIIGIIIAQLKLHS
jgi:hypothetical protein